MIKRKLYKIGHLTKMLGITSRTLRYYDHSGLLPHVKRSEGGMRLFDDEDVELIKRIRKIQREENLTLEQIRIRFFGERSAGSGAAIVTDGAAILPVGATIELPIHVLETQLVAGNKRFLSGEISPMDFWKEAGENDTSPSIAPPTEQDYIQTYQRLARDGHKRIYSIHQSSWLSPAFKNALAASHKVPGIDIQVIDSKSSGCGLGLLVYQIGNAIRNQDSREQIDILISKQIPLVHMLVMVDSLKYLVEGGLVSTPSAFVSDPASFLNKLFEFKPVFKFSPKTGDIDILECCKDKARALELIVDNIETEIKSRGNYVNNMMIQYSYLYGEAMNLANEIKSRFPNTEVLIQQDNGVLAAHVGPQFVSIAIT
ncbi:DegV family EDD domain-containing protein [bacterium]|nr:DegV family EDD domain-containing protein [bacterium]